MNRLLNKSDFSNKRVLIHWLERSDWGIMAQSTQFSDSLDFKSLCTLIQHVPTVCIQCSLRSYWLRHVCYDLFFIRACHGEDIHLSRNVVRAQTCSWHIHICANQLCKRGILEGIPYKHAWGEWWRKTTQQTASARYGQSSPHNQQGITRGRDSRSKQRQKGHQDAVFKGSEGS